MSRYSVFLHNMRKSVTEKGVGFVTFKSREKKKQSATEVGEKKGDLRRIGQ